MLYQYNAAQYPYNSYLESKNVRVFPCSFRGNYGDDNHLYNGQRSTFDPEARLNSESNITVPKAFGNLIPTYIISYEKTSANEGTLKCVIGGYYFELYNLNLSDLYQNNQIKKLYIKTRSITFNSESIDGTRATKVLASFDESSTTVLDVDAGGGHSLFIGLNFTVQDISDAYACLDVIEVKDGEPKIREASYLPNILHGAGKNSIRLNNGIAIGENAIVSGNSYTIASGKNSIALGQGHSLGEPTEASGENAIAFGTKSIASGLGSIAGGNESTASNEYSIAIGNGNTASGKNAVAFGEGTSASGNNSATFGKGTKTHNKPNSFVIGSYNDTLNTGDLFVVGDGQDESHKSNAFVVNANNIKLNHPTTITGATRINGNTTISGQDINLTGDNIILAGQQLTKINSATAITGDTAIAGATTIKGNVAIINGTLTSAKKLTISGGGADITGNVNIKDGTLTSAKKLTISSGGAAITGATTINGTTTIDGSLNTAGNVAVGNKTTNQKQLLVNTLDTNEIKLGDKATIYYDGNLHIKIEQ